MPRNTTKRLNNSKNNKSYQESLSPAEIKKKLEEYQQVDEIDDVKIGTHLRYFTFNPSTGKKQFRLGGFLSKTDKDYIVMNNGEFSWSVQKDKTVFFKKLTFGDLKEELVEKISKKYEKKIIELTEENIKLKNALKTIKKQLKNN
tara:strand:+ start:891 stop:1325 length:435 start_codon:yes stop_codon:yes gene_type:complete